ncbi:MAG: GNAT family N-acetyltransferase [Bacteroidetes bacterium]|nr:GNAT family N-acetyltransferase [Bacteroidota bacterium]
MVRNATAKDAKQICDIYNYYVKNSISTFEETPVNPSEMEGRIKKTMARFPWIVAIDKGNIIGFAYATEWKARPAYKFTVETSIYVDAHQSEKGIGKALYQKLLQLLVQYGFRNAIGSIALPNEASVMLHEHLGFKRTGKLIKVGIKFGQWIDVGLWQKTL